MKSFKLLFYGIIFSILFIGIANAYNPLDGVKAQKAYALTIVKDNFIKSDELKKWIQEGKKVVIVDVREPAEYYAGRIKNSILAPRGVIYGKVKKGILKPDNVNVIVCRTGHRAILVAATLIKWYNFKNVYVLKGGLKAWIKSGGAIQNSMNLGPVKIELLK